MYRRTVIGWLLALHLHEHDVYKSKYRAAACAGASSDLKSTASLLTPGVCASLAVSPGQCRQ